MSNIVLCVSLQHDDAAILIPHAIEQARLKGSKIWVIHVAAPDPDFVGYEPGPQSERDFRADKLSEKHQKIQNYARLIQKQGISAEALLLQGQTVETILEKAKDLQTKMIITGNENHGFFHNLFNENIALALLKQSNIPLLVIPMEN